MTGIEIAMIVIGLVLIVASYAISEKITGQKGEESDFLDLTKQGQSRLIEKIDESVDDALNNKLADYAVKADDELSKVSNDKIMAFHEYSQQVFEKIEHNHNEVVFLYDMLNEKEKELKDSIRLANNAQKELDVNVGRRSGNSTKNEFDRYKKEQQAVMQDKTRVDHNKAVNGKATQNKKENKDRILSMYEKGCSVVDISKELGIGQGEVKLVINLYKGNGRK